MKKLIKTVLIVCAVLFVILLIIPEDWLEDEEPVRPEHHGSAVTADNGGESPAQSQDISGIFSENQIRDQVVQVNGGGKDTVTILVYMNGSNLESEDGEATEDIAEMISASDSDKVRVVIQTMGTKKWQNYGISSKRSQRYEITKKGLELVDDSLKQLDCTKASTLSDFINWGAKNYPADRYMLVFWDHGGGPVYGFGYDEFQDEDAALTIDEMQSALQKGGVFFDFIGMDCCLMSSLEVCCALYDYCDYMVLSEDFESGLGWSYKGWLSALAKNSSISMPDLGKIIIDDMVTANEKDSEEGDSAILTLLDQSKMKILYTAWVNFAYANEDALLGNNYSQERRSKGRELPRFSWILNTLFGDDDETSLADYYITDIMTVAKNIDSEESRALESALAQAIVYNRASVADAEMTGLSVTLPYGDSEFYDMLKEVFSNSGFDSDYVKWLKKFTSAEGSDDFFDFGDWSDLWSGWDDFEDDFDWEDWDWLDDDEYWDSDDWGWEEDCWQDDDWGYGDWGHHHGW